MAASVCTVSPLQHYDHHENRMVTVIPQRWSPNIEMDEPDRFHERSVYGGFYDEREDAEAWIAAMLGDDTETKS